MTATEAQVIAGAKAMHRAFEDLGFRCRHSASVSR